MVPYGRGGVPARAVCRFGNFGGAFKTPLNLALSARVPFSAVVPTIFAPAVLDILLPVGVRVASLPSSLLASPLTIMIRWYDASCVEKLSQV